MPGFSAAAPKSRYSGAPKVRRTERTFTYVCSYLDYFGPDAKVKEPVAFDYEEAVKLYVDEKQFGLDFALLPLRDY